MAAIIKCGDCGFLAVRNGDTCQVYPADELLRMNAVLPCRDFPGDREPHLGVSLIRRSDTLLCYVGRPEMSCPPETYNCREYLNAIHECPRFIMWVPGKTPKEHEDMTILEQVRTEQSLFRLEERKERERQREEDRKSNRESRDKQDRHNDRTRRLAVGSLMVATLGGAAAFWNAFLKPEPPKPLPEPPVVVVVPEHRPAAPSQGNRNLPRINIP